MNNTIFNLLEEATRKEKQPRLEEQAKLNGLEVVEKKEDAEGDPKKITASDLEDQLHQAQEFVYAQFTGMDYEGKKLTDIPKLGIQEGLSSSDVSIVFPRVISEILDLPTEPELFLTNNLTEIIRLPDNAPLLIEFPAVDALQAFDMAEGQEYTIQTLSYQQHITSIRLKKIGVAAALNEEIIAQSMWPLVTLHLTMMAQAVDRKVESNLFQTMENAAQVVFDNENSDSDYHTQGKSFSAGSESLNATLAYDDIIKMAGILLGNRKNATHMLTHPLAWPILAQDPIMRAQFYHSGAMGAGIWTRLPEFDQSAAMPFGLTYVPYYNIPFTENNTLSGTFSGEAAVTTTEFYVLDRDKALYMTTRGDTEMDEMDDWFHDAKMMKARKYVGLSAKDRGTGMVRAKAIRVAKNEESLFTIRQVNS